MIYPISPVSSQTKTTHAYWENFLTDDQINRILSLPEWLDSSQAQVGGSNGDGRVEESIRKTNISWMRPSEQTKDIWATFANVFAHVNSKFFQFDLSGFYEPAQLGAYVASNNGHYVWHTDAGIESIYAPRKLSMALMLSDTNDFEGGNLGIKATNDDPVWLEQKRGRAWFFPAYTLHCVTPVTSGVRRSLVLWSGGPDFK